MVINKRYVDGPIIALLIKRKKIYPKFRNPSYMRSALQKMQLKLSVL
jgi:hypothetical protein